MVDTNGLDSRDPEFDDYGFSDFVSDYAPSDDQIAEWFMDDPHGAIKHIGAYGRGMLDAAWCESHEEEIEQEWDDTHEPQGEYQ